MLKLFLSSLLIFLISITCVFTQEISQYIPYDLRVAYDSYLQRGLFQLESRNYQAALRLFHQAQELIPALPDAYINLSVVNISQGNLYRAARNLEKAQKFLYPQYSQNNVFFYNKGLVEQLGGDYEAAYQYYQRALEFDSEMAEAIYAQALISQGKQDYQDALKKMTLAYLLFEKRADLPMAEALKRRVASLRSKVPSLEIDLVDASEQSFRRGEKEYAALFLEKFLQENPKDSQAYYRLGVIYAQREDFAAAIEAFEAAIKHEKDFVQAYINAGSAYGSIQEYSKALSNFKKALSLDKDNPNIHYNLAMVYFALAKPEQAHLYLEEAQRLASKKGESSLLVKIEELLNQ